MTGHEPGSIHRIHISTWWEGSGDMLSGGGKIKEFAHLTVRYCPLTDQ